MGDFWETDNAVQKMAYDTLNGEIKRTMRRSARDMVQIGCLLKIMMDKMMWQEHYLFFDDYLKSELQMDYTMATRFMKATEKYSVGGNSMEIKEKYEGYSQAVLIEMLNMPPELEERVTPDMTVKQVREVKRQAKQKDVKMMPRPMGLLTDPYCRICGEYVDEIKKPARCPKCGQLIDWEQWVECFEKDAEKEDPAGEDTVIDGNYREIDAPEPDTVESEEVATSQLSRSAYGLEKTEYPEGSLIAEAGCGHKYYCFSCAQACSIREMGRYCMLAPLGSPFNCEMMGILEKGDLEKGAGDRCQFVNNDLAYHKAGSGEASPCCRECKEICEYRCQRSMQGSKTLLTDADRSMITGQEPEKEEVDGHAWTTLQKCIIEYFRGKKEMLDEAMGYIAGGDYKQAAETISFNGSATFKNGNISLFMYDYKTGVKYKKFGTNEVTEMSWNDFLLEICDIFWPYYSMWVNGYDEIYGKNEREIDRDDVEEMENEEGPEKEDQRDPVPAGDNRDEGESGDDADGAIGLYRERREDSDQNGNQQDVGELLMRTVWMLEDLQAYFGQKEWDNLITKAEELIRTVEKIRGWEAG